MPRKVTPAPFHLPRRRSPPPDPSHHHRLRCSLSQNRQPQSARLLCTDRVHTLAFSHSSHEKQGGVYAGRCPQHRPSTLCSAAPQSVVQCSVRRASATDGRLRTLWIYCLIGEIPPHRRSCVIRLWNGRFHSLYAQAPLCLTASHQAVHTIHFRRIRRYTLEWKLVFFRASFGTAVVYVRLWLGYRPEI